MAHSSLEAFRMTWRTIEKPKGGWAVAPNLLDYEKVCAEFSWDAARRELDGLPGGRGLNIAHEAIDRHAAGALRDHLALRWIGKRGEITRLHICRSAHAHQSLRECAATPRPQPRASGCFCSPGAFPNLYISALGTLKNGNVFCPLFSAFGPEPIRQRIGIGDGRVLVTTAAALQTQGRRPARLAARTQARAADRHARKRSARFPTRSISIS